MTGNWFINKTREVIEAWNKDKITQSKDLIKINSDKTYTCTNKIFADGKWEINEGKMILYPSNYTNGKYVLSILDKKQESVTLFLSNKNNAVDVEYYFYLTK